MLNCSKTNISDNNVMFRYQRWLSTTTDSLLYSRFLGTIKIDDPKLLYTYIYINSKVIKVISNTLISLKVYIKYKITTKFTFSFNKLKESNELLRF